MFNNKIWWSILHETIRFGMVYVDLTNRTKKIQVGYNFSFNIDISWQLLIPDTQAGYGRICWFLSEILFCRPKMNKKNQIYKWKTMEDTSYVWSIYPYCFIYSLLNLRGACKRVSELAERNFSWILFLEIAIPIFENDPLDHHGYPHRLRQRK